MFISFNNGVTYRKYDGTSWVPVDTMNALNGMTINEVINLNTYSFNAPGGLNKNSIDNVVIRFSIISTKATSSVFLQGVNIYYNGPIIIDSWEEPGSFLYWNSILSIGRRMESLS